MKVISFATDDPYYQSFAHELRVSALNHGIDIDMETIPAPEPRLGVPERASVRRMCWEKPEFIYRKLLEHQQPVMWVDADTIFTGAPDFGEPIKWDVGVCDHHLPWKRRWIAACTVWNYTPGAIETLLLHRDLCAVGMVDEHQLLCHSIEVKRREGAIETHDMGPEIADKITIRIGALAHKRSMYL